MRQRVALAGILCGVTISFAAGDGAAANPAPVFIEPGPVQPAVIYADGQHLNLPTETRWRYVCGTDVSNLTADDLRRDVAAIHAFENAAAEHQVIGSAGLRTGVTVLFQVSGGLPAGAQDALNQVSAYFSTIFGDNVTVVINFSMTAMGGGVLGATGSNYASPPSWNTARTGLINGMDLDDQMQSLLPAGTLPVRYDGASATVTAENRVFFTAANYNATVGSLGGNAASMQLNTQFPWDYDPSNGVSNSLYCFRSVVVHEVCHALGFTSAADAGGGNTDIEALDIFRFQRTDGAGDYNPDTTAEFTTTTRTVSFNSPDDDANSNIFVNSGDIEYRMSDGSPNQASHFRQQTPVIGIMQPALSNGVTFYPNYMQPADIAMLDAIGWDYFAGDCNHNGQLDVNEIAANPALDCDSNGTLDSCEIASNDCNNDSILDACQLAGNDCNNTGVPDDCELAGNDCNANTDPDECDVAALMAQISAPGSQAPCQGGQAVFSVTAPPGVSYQWYQAGTPLSDNGHISGVHTPTLTINNVQPADIGAYHVQVTQGCISADSTNGSLAIVSSSLTVTQEPVTQVTLCASGGQSAVFDFHVDNELGVSFQWYKDGQPLSNGGRISGATSTHLAIASAEPSDAGFYAVHASNVCGGSADSNPTRGKLVVVGAVFDSQPQPTCTNAGGMARFFSRVDASADTQYFWYRNGNLLSNGNDGSGMIVSGASTPKLTLTNVPAAYNNHDIQLVTFVSSPSCIGQSNTAKLTVGACGPCRFKGDMDGDLDVDLRDLAKFHDCLGLPATPGGPCECANLDAGNGVIDLNDWTPLEPLFNGPF